MDGRYEFGPLRLDCSTRELWRGDQLVALTPKAFDLLRVLVASDGRVVEKDALMKLVWPDSFVGEDSLTQNIATLRKALGDNPDRQQYIVTVPRHGYRFAAAVRVVPNERTLSATSTPPDRLPAVGTAVQPIDGRDESRNTGPGAPAASERPRRQWSRAWIALLIVTILMAGALGDRIFSRPVSSARQVMRFTVPAPEGTTFSPSASFLTVSPNGRLLAFLASRPGEETRIWVRPLESLRARELIGTDGALGPFWSPDSRSVGFVAHDQLKTVSLLGEPPRTLCAVHQGTPSGTWNSDGVILFALGDSIARIPLTGGVPTPVTRVNPQRGELAHLLPQFLADGRHFVYLARGMAGGSLNSWIVLASLDGSERQPLIRASSQALYADPAYLLVLRDGELLAQPFDSTRFQLTGAPLSVGDADQVGFNPSTPRGMFAVSRTGVLAYRTSTVRELGWFDRSGRPLGWIDATGRDQNPALSPDGQRVAVSRYDPTTSTRNLWILDLEHAGIGSPFTSHFAWTNCPLWSTDGTHLVFASATTTGAYYIYEKGLNGADDARALGQHTNACPLDWSRDRQYLLYGTSRDSGTPESGLWLLPLTGHAAPKAVAGPWPRRVWAHFSPNGRWMAYVSDASGRYEVYVRSLPPENLGPWQVSSGGGIDPQWRGDGGELFFIGADRQLMAAPVTTEGSFRAGTPTALFPTNLDPSGLGISGRNQYVVAHDGLRFLLNQARPDAAPSPITVVVNWTAALK